MAHHQCCDHSPFRMKLQVMGHQFGKWSLSQVECCVEGHGSPGSAISHLLSPSAPS
ncbi:hypothetical protein LEMLEM_LOCUS16075, partial [Lemmus lemmus]